MQVNLRRLTTLSSIALLACAITAPLSAEEINGDELAQCIEVTNQLVSTHHVVFSSGAGHISFATDGGRLGIYGTDPVNGYSGCAYIYFHAD